MLTTTENTINNIILNTSIFNTLSAWIIIGLIVVLILLFLSALISGAEVAYFSLSPSQIKKLKHSKTSSSKVAIKLLNNPERLLATILISNNFINVGIVILSAFLTNNIFNFSNLKYWGFVIQVVLITFLLLLFGEVLPKVYAVQKALSFAKFMAYPLRVLAGVFSPLVSLMIKSTKFANKKFTNKNANISINDLSDALEMTEDESLKEEEKILKGIVKFGNIDVREIKVSRMDVKAIEIKSGFKDLINLIVDTGFSRIPVFEENFDNIKGVLYIKDLLPHLHKDNTFRWQTLIRPPYYVPENKKINDLLEDFRKRKIHMAIVVDEYGGTSGIVTLEDVLEEIVGDINDELDVQNTNYIKIDDNTFVFEGKTLLNDFYKVLNLSDDIFDDVKGEADTLAGLILEITGDIPDKNEVVEIENIKFKIKSTDDRRIKEVQVKIK
ncbi:MAG: gliding motility-associated protein GldE [Marinilabiliales bacterium]